jgi:hypothetical protein
MTHPLITRKPLPATTMTGDAATPPDDLPVEWSFRDVEVRGLLAAAMDDPHNPILASEIEATLTPWEKAERYAAPLAALHLKRQPVVLSAGERACFACQTFLSGGCKKPSNSLKSLANLVKQGVPFRPLPEGALEMDL